jgi:imidazoleglycerol-phosphate dehydratase
MEKAVDRKHAPRKAQVTRKTLETSIELSLNLDGGAIDLQMDGLGFFSHMIRSLAAHAGWGLAIKLQGDTEVDAHHSVEDTGLALGEALCASLGDFSEHERFGWALLPMDESLAEAALDVGRRPYLHLEVQWPQPVTGTFELGLVEEFFRALVQKAGWTLHLAARRGRNSHHLCEAMFKSVGRAARQALAKKPGGAVSIKGTL